MPLNWTPLMKCTIIDETANARALERHKLKWKEKKNCVQMAQRKIEIERSTIIGNDVETKHTV